MRTKVAMVNGDVLYSDNTSFMTSLKSQRKERSVDDGVHMNNIMDSITKILDILDAGISKMSSFNITSHGVRVFINTDNITSITMEGVPEFLKEGLDFAKKAGWK